MVGCRLFLCVLQFEENDDVFEKNSVRFWGQEIPEKVCQHFSFCLYVNCKDCNNMQETEILRWRFELLVKEDSKSSPFHSTFLPYLDLKKQTWDFDPFKFLISWHQVNMKKKPKSNIWNSFCGISLHHWPKVHCFIWRQSIRDFEIFLR